MPFNTQHAVANRSTPVLQVAMQLSPRECVGSQSYRSVDMHHLVYVNLGRLVCVLHSHSMYVVQGRMQGIR